MSKTIITKLVISFAVLRATRGQCRVDSSRYSYVRSDSPYITIQCVLSAAPAFIISVTRNYYYNDINRYQISSVQSNRGTSAAFAPSLSKAPVGLGEL